MDSNKKMDEKEFIQKVILNEVARLQKHDFYYLSFFVLSQAIEFLGSFLDKKPFRAKQQSKQRFSNAISTLFSSKYQRLNSNDWLYHKLRSHLAHSFVPSSWIDFTSKAENPKAIHLSRINKKTVFVAEDFLIDFESACQKLFKLLESGEVKSKKLDSNMVSFGRK